MASSAHLPVPDVGGQHLILLILREEEDTASAQGVLAFWRMGRACREDAAHQVQHAEAPMGGGGGGLTTLRMA